jgi:hypothetical protein
MNYGLIMGGVGQKGGCMSGSLHKSTKSKIPFPLPSGEPGTLFFGFIMPVPGAPKDAKPGDKFKQNRKHYIYAKWGEVYFWVRIK